MAYTFAVFNFFCILAVGFIDPSQKLNVCLICLSIKFFRPQDICVDAMRIELVDKKSIGEASAVILLAIDLEQFSYLKLLHLHCRCFWMNMAYFVIGSIFILSSIFLIFALPEPTRFEISYIYN